MAPQVIRIVDDYFVGARRPGIFYESFARIAWIGRNPVSRAVIEQSIGAVPVLIGHPYRVVFGLGGLILFHVIDDVILPGSRVARGLVAYLVQHIVQLVN